MAKMENPMEKDVETVLILVVVVITACRALKILPR